MVLSRSLDVDVDGFASASFARTLIYISSSSSSVIMGVYGVFTKIKYNVHKKTRFGFHMASVHNGVETFLTILIG